MSTRPIPRPCSAWATCTSPIAPCAVPIPQDPIVVPVRTSDGRLLRTARWGARGSRGTVLVAVGRSEFIEEYFAIVERLLARRFDVVVFDWRGQGLSTRECRHPAARARVLLRRLPPRPRGRAGAGAVADEEAVVRVRAFDGRVDPARPGARRRIAIRAHGFLRADDRHSAAAPISGAAAGAALRVARSRTAARARRQREAGVRAAPLRGQHPHLRQGVVPPPSRVAR